MTIDLKAVRERYQADRGDLRRNVTLAVASANDVPVLLDLVDKLAGTLLVLEWCQGESVGDCADCFRESRQGHAAKRIIDAALTGCGFPDAASRDVERARRAAR